jgi:ketosteroid isomerase-like protein
MKSKNISGQNDEEITKESDESSPVNSSLDTNISNNANKKLNPKWGKPVIAFAPKKKSASKLNPKWGKPVITYAPKKEAKQEFDRKIDKPVTVKTPLSETKISQITSDATPMTENKLEDINRRVAADVPASDKQAHATIPSASPMKEYENIELVEGSNNKKFLGVVIAGVVLFCAIMGYWVYNMQKSEKAAEDIAPPPAVVAVTVDHKEDVRNLVNKWLASWKTGDIKTYGSFYAADFESKGKNLDAWLAHKTNVSKKSKNINITIDNLQISADENKATAVFTQQYSSSITKDSGKKTLELRKINNEWKIYREIM